VDLGLSGKNVLMFGGNATIGYATSLSFAKEGANLLIASRDVVAGQKVAEKAKKLGSKKAIALKADATKWGDVEAAVKRAQKELGGIDICYHGVAWDVITTFFELDTKEWDRIIDVNLKSVLIAFKIVLPIMKEQRHGCFITMSSVMGRKASPLEPVYGACKAALINLVHTLATELGPFGVRVNVVAPGPTPPTDPDMLSSGSGFKVFLTDMKKFQERQEKRKQSIPLKKVGNPYDSAYAVLFLASDVTGAHQTGQVLGVDGGWYMPH
jgi:NAD(P)-dependent dehydrogenase (short-subunit alcohol dehydrogenase family)